jgi:hypothetical protein
MSIALALCALLLAGACSKDETTIGTNTPATPATEAAQQAELTPEQLGELGAEIKKNPNDAQRLLSEKGLTEQTFEQAIRKVSEDPAASQRYAAAYKQRAS